MKTLVIGACNIDIIGTSNAALIEHESNNGKVRISLGGVAKNIATNLNNLGADVEFLTLIGNDDFAKLQIKELNTLNLNYQHSFKKSVASSTYTAIHDETSDMVLAVNDMSSFEALKPNDFAEMDDYIKTFDVLVFDTNLAKESLEYLITKYQDKTIYVDGVSQSKVIRVLDVLNYVDLLKINQFELNALLNKNNCDIIAGVKQLNKQGLKTCLVSSSDNPITYNMEGYIYQSITHKIDEIKSTIGAGDALFSGVIFYLINGKNMHHAVNFGKLVASKTLEVYEACNKDIAKLIDL